MIKPFSINGTIRNTKKYSEHTKMISRKNKVHSMPLKIIKNP